MVSKTLKKFLLLPAFVLVGSVNAQEADNISADGFKFLPILLRYNGIGTFYGAAAGYKSREYGQFLLGGVGGDVQGGGAVYTLTVEEQHQLTASAGSFKLAPLTYFGRSSDIDDPFADTAYRQSTATQVAAIAYRFESDDLLLRASVNQVESRIDEFQNEDRDVIPTPDLNVIPFKQTGFNAGVSLRNDFGTYGDMGVRLDLDYTYRSSSSGYAGTQYATVKTTYHFFFLEVLRHYVRYRHSKVLAFSDPGYSRQRIRDEFGIDCAQAETEKAASCADLLNGLENYVYLHNTNGTAAPLGGSTYMKAYAEGRFRAAQTSYIGYDVHYILADSTYIPELYASFEWGSARDDDANPFLFDRESVGAGLYWVLGEANVLLFGGSGGDGGVVSLTVQQPQ